MTSEKTSFSYIIVVSALRAYHAIIYRKRREIERAVRSTVMKQPAGQKAITKGSKNVSLRKS